MTSPIFFDTDCLSSFFWVKKEDLLTKLYPNRIIIPEQVSIELSNPSVTHLRERLDKFLHNQKDPIMEIYSGTEASHLYLQLISKNCGKGEAACIALAKYNCGSVASNNLKDIKPYIKQFRLSHITTADILTEAHEKNYIDESQGNEIWSDMIKKKRKLGALTFSEYLEYKNAR